MAFLTLPANRQFTNNSNQNTLVELDSSVYAVTQNDKSDDEEKFKCKAINDYNANENDELDLKEGQEYTITRTASSGWWYAVNADDDEGWTPSNYLERIDNNQQQNILTESKEDNKSDKNIKRNYLINITQKNLFIVFAYINNIQIIPLNIKWIIFHYYYFYKTEISDLVEYKNELIAYFEKEDNESKQNTDSPLLLISRRNFELKNKNENFDRAMMNISNPESIIDTINIDEFNSPLPTDRDIVKPEKKWNKKERILGV